MLNLSKKFKSAHAITKQIIKSGDSYQATFSLVLKRINEVAKKLYSLASDFIGTAKNGKKFIEIEIAKGDHADSLIGKVFQSAFIPVSCGYSPRRKTFSAFNGGTVSTIKIDGVGSSFEKDGKIVVRAYGEVTEKSISVF